MPAVDENVVKEIMKLFGEKTGAVLLAGIFGSQGNENRFLRLLNLACTDYRLQ